MNGVSLMNNPPSPLRLLWRDRLTNFLCLSLLLLGATVLGMDYTNARLGQELLNAAMHGNFQEVERLITHGVSVETKDTSERTPLIMAAWNGHEAVCRLLIEKNASVEAKDNYLGTSLVYAAEYDREAVCRLLIDVQLEEARKNKAAIVIFLGIVRKRRQNLPCYMQYDVAKMIAHQAFETVQRDRRAVIEQIKKIHTRSTKAQWLAYANKQMNSANK
jgi:ankyrin repeat protein